MMERARRLVGALLLVPLLACTSYGAVERLEGDGPAALEGLEGAWRGSGALPLALDSVLVSIWPYVQPGGWLSSGPSPWERTASEFVVGWRNLDPRHADETEFLRMSARRLDSVIVLGIWPDAVGRRYGRSAEHLLLPLKVFAQLELHGDSLRLRWLDSHRLIRRLDSTPDLTPHYRSPGSGTMVLTGSSRDLASFLRRVLPDTGLFKQAWLVRSPLQGSRITAAQQRAP